MTNDKIKAARLNKKSLLDNSLCIDPENVCLS